MKVFPSRRRVSLQGSTHRPLGKVLWSAVFLVTSLLSVTAASTAAAAPIQYEFSADAGELCDFAVSIVVNDNTKIVENEASQVYSTGAIKITVTNTNNDTKKKYNISGPTFDDGTLTGPALILQPASAGLGDPFLIINYGRVTFNEDTSIDTITGKQTDICAQLA